MGRAHRWVGLFALVCAAAFMARVALAQTDSAGGRSTPGGRPVAAQPYRPGPIDDVDRSGSWPDWPTGARELLGLTVLAAIVYGLRASDLGRHAGRPRSSS